MTRVPLCGKACENCLARFQGKWKTHGFRAGINRAEMRIGSAADGHYSKADKITGIGRRLLCLHIQRE